MKKIDAYRRIRVCGVRIPLGARDFSLLQKRPEWLWGSPSLQFNGYRRFFPGVKRPGRKVNHSPPSSVEVKNMWCFTSTTSIRLQGADTETMIFLERQITLLHSQNLTT